MNNLELIMSFGGVILTIVNLWLLFAVKAFKDEMLILRTADAALTEKIAAINVLVAGQYITRNEFKDAMSAQTSTILQRMEDITKRYQLAGIVAKGDD